MDENRLHCARSPGFGPAVSCVIPAYNAESHLARAVRSVQAQTFSPEEIIVVDDGSRDGTRKLAEQLAQEDKRIVLLGQENRGVSAARNAGAKCASGDYVAFLDADDVWLPDHLERFASANLKGSRIYSCGSPKDKIPAKGKTERLGPVQYIKRVLGTGWGFNISGTIIPRDAFEKEEFRLSFQSGEECDLVLRLVEREEFSIFISNEFTVSLDLNVSGAGVSSNRLSFSGIVGPNAIIAFCDEQIARSFDIEYQKLILALRRRTELSVFKSLVSQGRFSDVFSASKIYAETTMDPTLRLVFRALALLRRASKRGRIF